MKLEKVNDRQIRCTLTKADLADRELKLSELAYGTEKAKTLFRDMMQQAAYEFGFEAEDIPLMIEAIPLSSESIVLIITKVEDPEELDTRFSNFAPSVRNGNSADNQLDNIIHSLTEDPETVLDLFKKLKQKTAELKQSISATAAEIKQSQAAMAQSQAQTEEQNLAKAFSFDSLDAISRLSGIINPVYHGRNSLYKDLKTGRYLLVVNKTDHTESDFNKVCNMISEYGHFERLTGATEAYLEEADSVIIRDNALEKLDVL
ncbi:MAG: adaptor protein MecA [Lachnospiraceae bacterium]|nr:adaptor protein MecA [Lachnospiraceae bacterium]